MTYKILLHTNHPDVGSGYGVQANLFAGRWAKLGYEVAISAFWGQSQRMSEWTSPQGTTHVVYGSTKNSVGYGGDIVGMHARHFGADLVITLMDQWALAQDTLQGLKVACWMPVDAQPLSQLDRQRLVGRWPIAMSRFGETTLKQAGYRPLYVPHGVDTSVFIPPLSDEGREILRDSMGVTGKFVFFMNAANQDRNSRKSWMETIEAFSALRRKHDDVMLMIHACEDASEGGIDLKEFSQLMGVYGDVKFSIQYLQAAGIITQEQLRAWYGMADCYLIPSKAEGFGVTAVEAMACGVPVIAAGHMKTVTGATVPVSAMPEVVGKAGYLVDGEEVWVVGHRAKWGHIPARNIYKAMEKAYLRDGVYQAKRRATREQAMLYDVDKVTEEYWAPVLETLGKRL